MSARLSSLYLAGRLIDRRLADWPPPPPPARGV